jgi:hypothetical protein
MRQCHIRDGTALVEYFAWLENELNNGTKLDEVQAADKLEEFRRYPTRPFSPHPPGIILLPSSTIMPLPCTQLLRGDG